MDWLRALLTLVVVVVAAWLIFIAILWLHRPTRELAGPALRLLPDLAGLVRRLLTEPDVPLSVRLALMGLLAWLVSPIDLVPEFIPVLGPLDDIVVAILVLRFVTRRMGPDRLERLWPGRSESLDLMWRLVGRPAERRPPADQEPGDSPVEPPPSG